MPLTALIALYSGNCEIRPPSVLDAVAHALRGKRGVDEANVVKDRTTRNLSIPDLAERRKTDRGALALITSVHDVTDGVDGTGGDGASMWASG